MAVAFPRSSRRRFNLIAVRACSCMLLPYLRPIRVSAFLSSLSISNAMMVQCDRQSCLFKSVSHRLFIPRIDVAATAILVPACLRHFQLIAFHIPIPLPPRYAVTSSDAIRFWLLSPFLHTHPQSALSFHFYVALSPLIFLFAYPSCTRQ